MDPIFGGGARVVSQQLASRALFALLKKSLPDSDIERRLERAFDRALKNSGVVNDQIRRRYLERMDDVLEVLTGENPTRTSEFSDKVLSKVLQNLRIELANEPELYNFVQQLSSEQSDRQSQQLARSLGELSRPIFFQDVLERLASIRPQPSIKPLSLADYRAGGRYVRNDKVHAAALQALSKDRLAHLVGQPAVGKTSVALGIAVDWASRENGSAFYVSAKRLPSTNEWFRDVSRLDSDNVLLIIDDAQYNPDEVLALLGRWGSVRHLRLLVISQIRSGGLLGLKTSMIFERLSHARVELIPDVSIARLIAESVNDSGLLSDRDAKWLLDATGGDLHILGHLAASWDPERFPLIEEAFGPPPHLDQVVTDVRRRYFVEVSDQAGALEGLLDIASISQFGLDVESGCLLSQEVQHRLLETGIVSKTSFEEDGITTTTLRIFHDQVASLILGSAQRDELRRLSRPQYEAEIIGKYVQEVPFNIDLVFIMLSDMNRGDILDSIIKSDYIEPSIVKYIESISNRDIEDDKIENLWRILLIIKNTDNLLTGRLYKYIVELTGIGRWRNADMGSRPRDLIHTVRMSSFDPSSSSIVDANLDNSIGNIISIMTLDDKIDLLGVARFSPDKNLIMNLFQINNTPENFAREISERGLRVAIDVVKLFIYSDSDHEYIRSFCNSIDLSRFTKLQINLQDVSRFLHVLDRGDASKDVIRSFIRSIDLVSMSKKASRDDTPAITYIAFIRYALEANIPHNDIRPFLDTLDFRTLGMACYDAGWGLTALTKLVHVIGKARLPAGAVRALLEGVDPARLGQRARSDSISASQVRRFIDACNTASVPAPIVVEFLSELHLEEVGRSISSDKTGLTSFVRLTLYIIELLPINYAKLYLKNIDFEDIGRRAIEDVEGIRLALPIFYILGRPDVTHSGQAESFFNAVGWDRLRDQASNFFSPVALAALRIALVRGLGLDQAAMDARGFRFRSEIEWFRSFTTRPISRDYFNEKWHQGLRNYALKGLLFRDLHREIRSRPILSLSEWNVFASNLGLIDFSLVSEYVSDYLESLSSAQITDMISSSDIRNVSIFFRKFGGVGRPTFSWKLPRRVRFDKIPFEQWILECTLSELAFFLFGFNYINRPDINRHFAHRLLSRVSVIEELIDKSQIIEIDLFFWNWWISLGPGEALPVLDGLLFAKLEKNIGGENKTRSESALLGLAGTLSMAGGDVPIIQSIDVASIMVRTSRRKPSPQFHRIIQGAISQDANISDSVSRKICKSMDSMELLFEFKDFEEVNKRARNFLNCQ